MPTYDYECRKCEEDFVAFQSISTREEAHCPKCGKKGRLLPPQGRGPAAVTFRSGYYPLDYHPVFCETAQQLRDECDKRNVYSHYLENSSFKTSPGPDPTPDSAPECYNGNRGASSPD